MKTQRLKKKREKETTGVVKKKRRRCTREVRLEIAETVKSIFDTEAPDTTILGEIRAALASPKKRDVTRTKLVSCLFRGKGARILAREFSKTRPVWMSELSQLRLKKVLKKYKKARGD